MTESVPDRVSRFEILDRLGSGGVGEVYAARDPKLRRRVALKRLLPGREADPETRRLLLHEAQAAARVQHQNIAALHDVIEVDGQLWLVMEYVEGRSLRQLSLPLSVDRVLTIALQCARALAAAHREGIVHGDIKPGNVMLDKGGEVKILDFGVAGIMGPVVADDATMTRAWQAPGATGATVSYAAPEVLLGHDSDHRADAFSLGVMLYELLSGENPFRADGAGGSVERILHLAQPPLAEVRREVPRDLSRVVQKMLSKDPSERHATTADLVVDLEAAGRRYRQPWTQPPAEMKEGGDAEWPVDPVSTIPDSQTSLGIGWAWLVAGVLLVVALTALSSVWWPERTSSDEDGTMQAVGLADVTAPGHLVAVLPSPTVESQDPDVAALSRGVISILTARLAQASRTRDLQVLPTSLLQESGVSGLGEAYREMGVTLAVQVDARRVGEEVRITTNLVDTAARRQIDADTLVDDLDRVIELEERVALRVMRMLQLTLQPEQELASGTSEPRAYAFYVQGRGYLADYTNPSDVEAAVQLFQRALDIDTGFAAAHAGLGEALWHRYRHTNEDRWVGEALQECRTAVAIDDALPTSHVCLGVLYAGTGRVDDAIAAFQRAVALDPTLDAALRGLASAYEDGGQLELAEVTYEQAIEARPRYWVGHNWLGAFYVRRGRFEEAVGAFREVVELTPDSYRGYTNLGVAYYNLERWSDARAAFERALEIRPEDQMALSNLGTLAFFEGDYRESARRFEQALETSDQEYWIWGNLADTLHWGARVGADLGADARARAVAAYRRAIDLGRQALEVNPNDVVLLRDVALYHAMLGEAEAADEFAALALRHGGSDVHTQVWAAKVYAQLGDDARSIEHLRTALEMGYQRAEILADPTFDGLVDNPEFRTLTAADR